MGQLMLKIHTSRFVVVVVDTITDLTHTSRKMPPRLPFKLLTTKARVKKMDSDAVDRSPAKDDSEGREKCSQ